MGKVVEVVDKVTGQVWMRDEAEVHRLDPVRWAIVGPASAAAFQKGLAALAPLDSRRRSRPG